MAWKEYKGKTARGIDNKFGQFTSTRSGYQRAIVTPEQLKELNAKIVPIEKIEGIEYLPVEIEGTLCILPTELYEGFFVAKIRK